MYRVTIVCDDETRTYYNVGNILITKNRISLESLDETHRFMEMIAIDTITEFWIDKIETFGGGNLT